MHTPADVLAQLARGPAVVRALLADVRPADLRRRPQPGRWSAHEHGCHLALMEPRWAERAALPPGAWPRPARHTGHARYSLFLMARHAALHDMLHAYRIEESVLGTHWPTEPSEP